MSLEDAVNELIDERLDERVEDIVKETIDANIADIVRDVRKDLDIEDLVEEKVTDIIDDKIEEKVSDLVEEVKDQIDLSDEIERGIEQYSIFDSIRDDVQSMIDDMDHITAEDVDGQVRGLLESFNVDDPCNTGLAFIRAVESIIKAGDESHLRNAPEPVRTTDEQVMIVVYARSSVAESLVGPFSSLDEALKYKRSNMPDLMNWDTVRVTAPTQ